MPDNLVDGGDRALLGFLFQMMVTLGIGSLGGTTTDQGDETTLEADAYGADLFPISLLGEAFSVIPEQFGQDLFAVSDNHRMLLQMKFSRDPLSHQFYLSDFGRVFTSFVLSCVEMDKQKEQLPDSFVIVTNRAMRTDVEQVKKQAQEVFTWLNRSKSDTVDQSSAEGNRPIESFVIEGTTTLRDKIDSWWTTKADQTPADQTPADQTPAQTDVTPTKRKRNKKPAPNLSDEQVRAALHVFPRLIFCFGTPTTLWREAFERFARSYGAFDDEIDAAVQQLLGIMLVNSGKRAPLERGDFVKVVTKFRNALALTPATGGKECAAIWREHIDRDGHLEDWMLRRDISGLADALSRKVVIVIGDGGCGKSVFLSQVAQPVVEKLANDPLHWEGFVAAASCADITDDWLEQCVGAWGKRGGAGKYSLDRPLERLDLANTTRLRRLLWLTLDGLDENCPNDPYLRQLIKWAEQSEQNDICLVFSCREQDREKIDDLLRRNQSGPRGDLENDPNFFILTVPAFTKTEVVEIILKVAPEALADDFVASQSGRLEDAAEILGQLVQPFLVQSLMHPRMLGAFVAVIRKKKAQPQDLLMVKPEALRFLSEEFLYLFFYKYRQRQISKQLPDSTYLKNILVSVSRKGFDPITISIWRKQATKEGLGLTQADLLLREAESGGLFLRDGDTPKYFWRHGFVANYLGGQSMENL